jgi:hypothetical protein
MGMNRGSAECAEKDRGKKIRFSQELTERREAGIFGGRKTEPDHAVNPAGCFLFLRDS